jgi:hypothetical protein
VSRVLKSLGRVTTRAERDALLMGAAGRSGIPLTCSSSGPARRRRGASGQSISVRAKRRAEREAERARYRGKARYLTRGGAVTQQCSRFVRELDFGRPLGWPSRS